MVILHFAYIDNSKTNGVCVAVQQHVKAQGHFAETALINVSGIVLSGGTTQLSFPKPFDVRSLPKPFDAPNLVIFHECYRLPYLSISQNLIKNKIPYIIIPHGELRKEAQKKKHLKKIAANFLLFNRFINHALALQCLSENELNSTKFHSRKFLGGNGANIPQKTKTSFSKEGVEFLYIGRYEWRVKGLDILLDAIKIEESFLRKNRCHFSLYGPDYADRFSTVAEMVNKRNIADLVGLNLSISGKEKEEALLAADIFIQTSRHEGMPMGILEAMSYSLPCLITEGTSLGKIVGDANAGWVAETTADSVAEKLVDAVLDRQNWSKFGENGKNEIKEHFSWDVIASDAVKRYQKIISEIEE